MTAGETRRIFGKVCVKGRVTWLGSLGKPFLVLYLD
jgi:hypothetical protein